MSLSRWFRKLTCPHQYEKISELKDDEEEARAVTIVRACGLCGDVITNTFSAPKRIGCPPHKWADIERTNVFDNQQLAENRKNGKVGTEGLSRIGIVVLQKCEQCGELRRINFANDGETRKVQGPED